MLNRKRLLWLMNSVECARIVFWREITNRRSFSPQFSLFGSRSNNRPATNPPLPPSPSVSVTPSPQTFRRAERTPCSGGLSKAEFLERVRRSNQACQEGEFALAVHLYTEALTADPQNCILYSNRSAAYLRLGQYGTALEDAVKARLINPKWPKVRAPTPAEACLSSSMRPTPACSWSGVHPRVGDPAGSFPLVVICVLFLRLVGEESEPGLLVCHYLTLLSEIAAECC